MPAYLLLTILGVVAALLLRRVEPAVVASSFGLVLVLGLRRNGPLELAGEVRLHDEQALEGQLVHGDIVIDRPNDIALEVILSGNRVLPAVDPAPDEYDPDSDSPPVLAWQVPAGPSPLVLPFTVRADRWGRHGLGDIRVRARVPGGLLVWEGDIGSGPAVRVLPSAERLHRLLDPAMSRAASGQHPARAVGDGSEFAEIRPYQPGDRLRNLNWRATARQGEPHVNRQHPERAGDVVILIDTFADGYSENSAVGHEAMARMARGAWALAQVHLAAQDRVGFLAYGRVSSSLIPASGGRARYQLLDTLLAVGGAVASNTASTMAVSDRAIPINALVIGLTPLYDSRAVITFQTLRSRGRAVAVVVVDLDDLLGEPLDEFEEMARRMWKLGVGNRVRQLESVGISTVLWPGQSSMSEVIRSLGSRQRRTKRHVGRQ